MKTEPDNSLLIATEKKLLSALMTKNGEAIPLAAATLKADDFYRVEHRLIFKALVELSDTNTPIDVDIVAKQLERNGDWGEGKVTFNYLFGSVYPCEYTTLRCETYIAIIKEASSYRKLRSAGMFLEDAAAHERMPIKEIFAEVEKRLTEAETDTTKSLTQAKELYLPLANQLLNKEQGTPGLRSGFFATDSYTGGLKPSDMLILAARPSMGKTALAMNIAAEVAKKYTVLFFSLEMNRTQLIERIVAAAAKVNATKIQHRNLNDAELERVLDEADRVNDMKLFIDDTAGIGLPEIKMKARKVQREHGLDLIVIDYLQLMQSSKAYQGNRVQEVSELSRGIKSLARELNIPILTLSQLSRGVEVRADKRPMLSDLRESGSIEQDADIVMFLYRDEYYDRDSEAKGLAELIIAKNRNGAIGQVPLRFEKEFVRFEELTRPA